MWLHLISLLLLLLSTSAGASVARPVVEHQLEVTLAPERHELSVHDRIILPAAVTTVEFLLHANLTPTLEQATGARLESLGTRHDARVPARAWLVRFDRPRRQFSLAYHGALHHPVTGEGRHGGTPGSIGPKGVFLAASSLWFPYLPDRFVRFDMALRLPDGWLGVSQGGPTDDGGWHESRPQDDIYLVAAPYRRYQQATDAGLAQVFLRRPDPELAARYLAATGDYLRLYGDLIGPYPYPKFALVENFWESGYGMPSFTLLGPRVIRLPFILHSSYPHEILHNWWGNGVFVDYAGGNWAEGMTAYLADHLLRERRGQGAAYRRDTLQHYASYVRQEKDFPLTAFRGNHGEVSQAVGYGRMLMFLHMLRLRLGDAAFVAGIRRFWRDNRFRIAGFDDLRRAFEAVSGEDLKADFRTWTGRTGAPALAVSGLEVSADGDGFLVRGLLRQTQDQPPFPLRVPVYVQTAGDAPPRRFTVAMTGRERRFALRTDRRPLRLAVDPLFDLFRRLAPGEVPASLSRLFGSDRFTLLLPAAAPGQRRQAWRALAGQWRRRYPGLRVVEDAELEELPEGAVWILGRENRFAARARALLAGREVTIDERELEVGGQRFERAATSLVLAVGDGDRTLGYIEAASATAIPLLARKLPHYGKYGYLLFDGDRVENRVKGQWRATASALTVALVAGAGTLPPLEIPPHRPLVPAP